MIHWDNLYCQTHDSVALVAALRAALSGAGYTGYDPFHGVPGLAYPVAVRSFVAPAAEGRDGPWVRILLEADDPGMLPALAGDLSQLAPAVLLRISDDGMTAMAFHAGAMVDMHDGLAAALPGVPIADVARALDGQMPVEALDQRQVGVLTLEDLPADMRQVVVGTPQKQVNRLVQRVGRRGGVKAGDLPEGILRPVDWNSDAGRRVRALASVLGFPAGWHAPDFASLRAAYPLHARRERQPDAFLYPGDADALAAVPHALDYTPVYAGRDR
jgi:hypothetical protein